MTVRLVLCMVVAALVTEPLVEAFEPGVNHVLFLIWLGVGVEIARRAWSER